MSGGVLLNQDHQDRRRGQQRDRIFDLEALQGILCCPECRSSLLREAGSFVCQECGAQYPIVNGIPRFVELPAIPEFASSESWLNHLKNKFKAYPNLYWFLANVCSPVMPTGKSPQILLNRLPSNAVVLNLGSGTKRISSSVINVDLLPFKEVDIVADITRVPFQDNSIDGIISQATLEHVPAYQTGIEEMQRILKSSGYLYVSLPFLQGYHPSPDDYYRWTIQGLVADFNRLETIETGIRGGPTSALLWILQEWLALALSFNIPLLYKVLWIILMVLTFPFKLLDLVLSRYSMAWKIAATFYYLGVKK